MVCAKAFGRGPAQYPDRAEYPAGTGGLRGTTLCAVLGGINSNKALLSGNAQPLLMLGVDGFRCEVNQGGFPFGVQGASVLSVPGSLCGSAEVPRGTAGSVPLGGTTGPGDVLLVAQGGITACRAGADADRITACVRREVRLLPPAGSIEPAELRTGRACIGLRRGDTLSDAVTSR